MKLFSYIMKSRFAKTIIGIPILFIMWMLLIGSDDRPGFLRLKILPMLVQIQTSGSSTTVNAYGEWVFENTPTGVGGGSADSVWNIITLGNDTENVDGKIVFIDASGGTGDVEIGSDRLTFSGFSGGVDVDGALTTSTVTSDGAIIAETSLTINPTVVDTEDPSFIIKGDADSDGAATTSEALTINLAAAADPTDALWTATTTQSAGFDFDMPLIASTVTSDGDLAAGGNISIIAGSRLEFMANNASSVIQAAAGTNSDLTLYGAEFVAFSTFSGSLRERARVTTLGNFHLGAQAVFDENRPSFSILGDADTDGTTTSETFTIDLTGASDPTDSYWLVQSTQSDGINYDMNVQIADRSDLASESLADIADFSQATWTLVGEVAVDGTNAKYTFSSTGNGTITQTSGGDMAIDGVGSRWYVFDYTVSGVSGLAGEVVTITTAFALTAVTLDVSSNGAQSVTFKSAVTPANFVIDITSVTAGTFTITDVSLKMVNGGDVTLAGDLVVQGDININPGIVDNLTPSFVIGVDGDSDAGEVEDRSLIIDLTSGTNANTVSWEFLIANAASNNKFKFTTTASMSLQPGGAILMGSAPKDIIDLDAALWQTDVADMKIDPDEGSVGILTLGDPGDNDTTFVNGIFKQSIVVGITAVNPGVQGDGVLTADINEVSTVGTSDDAVTLAGAIAGRAQTIINNGVNQLEIFPASGDDLGAGANTATTLAAGATVTFLAYDTTTWVVKSTN